MATTGLVDIQNNSWGRTVMKPRIATGWQSSPSPSDKHTVVEDQIVIPDLALWLL